MIERNIQSRFVNKHDIEKNWNKAVNFIPKKGEFIIYDIDENYDYPRLKVGDGATVVGQLPFADRDIRNSITELATRLNALADSDDTTLDQLSEIVAYIKSNKDLINAITTDKVSVEDIVDNLTTNATNKPLSAAQGMQLKKLVDTKVNKVEGKGLSSNDYTDTEKTKLAGIQEGAVRSWNGLADKPFGEVPTNVGNTLALPDFTPITSSDVFLKYMEDGEGVLGIRHITDSVPSKEDLIGGTLESLWSDTLVIAEENLLLSNEIIAVQVQGTPIVIVALVDNATVNFMDIEWKLPKRGIYAGCIIQQGNDYYIEVLRKLTLPTYNFIMPQLKKIEPKFLPEGIGYVIEESSNTLTWDGVVNEDDFTTIGVDTSYCKISDATPSFEQLSAGGSITITLSAGTGISTFTAEDVKKRTTNIVDISSAIMIAYEDNATLTQGEGNPTIFPKKGIYFAYGGVWVTGYVKSLTLNGFELSPSIIHKIDEKFLPDTVATKADIQAYIDNAILNGAW